MADGEQCLTYAELDERVRGLGARLQACGVGPETVVAVALPRSAALVGVTRAGAVYLPIHPVHASVRTAFVLADGAPRVLITDTATAPTLPDTDIPILLLDAETEPDPGGTAARSAGTGGP